MVRAGNENKVTLGEDIFKQVQELYYLDSAITEVNRSNKYFQANKIFHYKKILLTSSKTILY